MSNSDNDSKYREKLSIEFRQCAIELYPSLSSCDPILNYSQLLLLDTAVLAMLVKYEKARVNLLELDDPSIDFRSSGHYRDKLEIYEDALSQKQLDGGYIYMDEKGNFLFNILDDISGEVLIGVNER